MSFIFDVNRQGIAHIHLNRPEIHNAFNDDLINKLTHLFQRLAQEIDARLVILTGEGKSFCAGADITWMRKQKHFGMEENQHNALRIANMYEQINNCPIPVIAAIHGAALGGGSGLAAVCDYVLSTKDAVFGFPETRLGIAPAVISPYVIAKIGESHARAWFLSGERFGAEQAQRISLIHEIVEDRETLTERTQAVAESFMKASPNAAQATKKLIAELPHQEDKTAYTTALIAELRASEDGQEGMSALLEKRHPKWKYDHGGNA